MSVVPSLQTAAAGGLTSRAAKPVFVATIGLSAFLLFVVQPLFARLVLPILGGSPAVWSVATVVFQCLLLAGYAYAHALARLRGRTAYLIHLGVLAGALIALPIRLAPGWTQAPAGLEAPWLAALMLVSIGLPFFAVAANGPLLQAWFAKTGDRRAADPYFLYAASNFGSFAALAAYPFLIEPAFRLSEQTAAWSAGFCVLIALIALAGAMMLRSPARGAEIEIAEPGEARPTTWTTRLTWIGLSAVPAGLLVAATAHLSTDLAPIPLLWIVPLGLYLLSFIIAFRPGCWLDDPRLALPRVGLTCIALIGLGRAGSFALDLAVHLGLFTVTALLCHRMLYRLRPAAGDLTGFYLALSVGGAIGGVCCGLLAPLMFDTLAEYSLFLMAALACRPDTREQAGRLLRDGVWMGALCVVAILAVFAAAWLFPVGREAGLNVVLISIAILGMLRWRSVGATVTAAAAMALLMNAPVLRSVESVRSFFGIHRVMTSDDGRFRVLAHGTTIHGAVRIREDDGSIAAGRPEPTTYYGFGQVIAQAIEATRAARGGRLARVSAIGLGTGSLACHRRGDEDWTFYEIDSAVVRIARERFPFLASCGAQVPIVVGDARLTLAGAATGQDLIVVDAFSSDSIPIHLLTREALGLYLSRLAPGGVVALHISNRHLDLSHVLARAASEHGLVAAIGQDRDLEPFTKRMRSPARVVLLARDRADFGPIASGVWTPLTADAGRRPWTDDFSNVLEALWDQRVPPRSSAN